MSRLVNNTIPILVFSRVSIISTCFFIWSCAFYNQKKTLKIATLPKVTDCFPNTLPKKTPFCNSHLEMGLTLASARASKRGLGYSRYANAMLFHLNL